MVIRGGAAANWASLIPLVEAFRLPTSVHLLLFTLTAGVRETERGTVRPHRPKDYRIPTTRSTAVGWNVRRD
jgi:hypothetical protein